MEKLLWLYSLLYDKSDRVVCFGERLCFLIGEEVEPMSMQSAKVAKKHYAYVKNGSCALLAAIDPLTGRRQATMYERRTKKEYAMFVKALTTCYPEAIKIRLVQDNLNTHNISSLYEHFNAQEAFALLQRFEYYYITKSSIWLNMIEIEFSALAKQCLHRRIANQQKLREEIEAIVKERNDKQIKINWQFSTQTNRSKMNSCYCRMNPIDKRYQKT